MNKTHLLSLQEKLNEFQVLIENQLLLFDFHGDNDITKDYINSLGSIATDINLILIPFITQED